MTKPCWRSSVTTTRLSIRRPRVARPRQSRIDHLYVGLTGSPKGVVGLHRGLVNRLQWMAASFPFHESGPTLARTSLSFVDGSTELLGPLTAGGPVVLAAPEAANDPRTRRS